MEELFKRYVAVQYSGIYHMFMEAHDVMQMIDCNEKDYFYIIENYAGLKKKYPKAWEEGKEIGVEMSEQLHG